MRAPVPAAARREEQTADGYAGLRGNLVRRHKLRDPTVLDRALADFARTVAARGVEVHANAYRQADFIGASIRGGGAVVRDAVVVVVVVLLLTLLELRTILVVLCTMPLSILLGVALFPLFGLGVNVMTLGGFAVAAGDIVGAPYQYIKAAGQGNIAALSAIRYLSHS